MPQRAAHTPTAARAHPARCRALAARRAVVRARLADPELVRGVGEKAEAVVEQVKTMRKILAADGLLPADDDYPPEIGALLIVDRAADLAHFERQDAGHPERTYEFLYRCAHKFVAKNRCRQNLLAVTRALASGGSGNAKRRTTRAPRDN